MKYALNIGADGCVLSVTLDRYGAQDQPRVNALPDGDISAYDWITDENGENGTLVLNEARAAEIAAEMEDAP